MTNDRAEETKTDATGHDGKTSKGKNGDSSDHEPNEKNLDPPRGATTDEGSDTSAQETNNAERRDVTTDEEGSEISPPVQEISVDGSTGQESQGSHGRLPLPSLKFAAYALASWVGLLVLVISLERAGVTESLTDIRFEEFLVRTGWSYHNTSAHSSPHLSQRIGYKLAQEGAGVKYPVVMIPGFITSGLELWDGKPCARSKYFRQRMWGGIGTARQFFTERDCWREHLALDPFTGMDPEGIRLRSCTGFEAADYFAANYWVWSKLIENLADLGYDGSTMSMRSYDWRLSFPLLEERDGYCTRLKHHIEAMHKVNGRKVVLAAHSMGSQLLVYFFAWVTTDEVDGGGGGGRNWVDEHIHAFINIAGPMLGVPKAVPALLSGEMKDTSLFVGVFGSMIEEFFGRRLRKDLWITWGSLWAMLPKGGNAVWGIGADMCTSSSTCVGLWCRDSMDNQPTAIVPFFQLTDAEPAGSSDKKFHCEGNKNERRQARYLSKQIDEFSRKANHSVEESLIFLQKWGGGHGPSTANAKLHSFDEEERPSQRTWSDPSRTALPYAPKLKIYCLYGVGLQTERAYFLKRNTVNVKETKEDGQRMCNNSHFDPPLLLNTSVDDAQNNIVHGVKFSDGDGSVPLLSLGYLCVDAWKRKELNPSGSKVITREYPDAQEFTVDDPMRGGPHAADHVDILGNVDMMEDFLRVVSDHQVKNMKSHIVSDILNISERIDAHPNGGLYVPKKKQNPFEVFMGIFDKERT